MNVIKLHVIQHADDTNCSISNTSSSKNCCTGKVKPGMFSMAQLPEYTTTKWFTLRPFFKDDQGKLIDCRANSLWPSSATVVSTEPFSHGTGTLWCLQKEMAIYRHWSVSLWRNPDDVSHCRILSPDKTEWWLIPATLCRWRHCFLAD